MIVKHRAFRSALTRSYKLSFKPKHCAGETCLHDHVGDKRPSLPLWRAS